MITFLVIALEIHLECHVLMLLQLSKTFRQIFLIKVQFNEWKAFNNLREVMKDYVLFSTHIHGSVNNLVDNMISSSLVSQMRSQRLLS